MTAKKSQPADDAPVRLLVPIEVARRQIGERIASGEELKKVEIPSSEQFKAAQQEYWTWTEYNEEMLRQMFSTAKFADEYSSSFGFFAVGGSSYLRDEIKDLRDDIDKHVRRLSSIRERLDLIPSSPESSASTVSTAKQEENRKVFVVHGHDEAARETLARFIEKLGLLPVILHEQANQGKTLIEKLEHHSDVAFAVVLLTPDDVGGAQGKPQRPRARQNVVMELGYFLGRLERRRVCALYRDDLELPSDYIGVAYVPLDGNGGWRLQLAKELRAAGFSVDMNDAL